MIQTIATATVPGSPVTITIEKVPADARLASILKDKPGTGRWVDSYRITQQANGALHVGPATLSTGRPTESEARSVANGMWTHAVSQRDKACF